MGFRIVEGAENMKTEEVAQLLHTTYWAEKRPVERIETSMANSACFGVYSEEAGALVGFARVITDWATTYYLCDVVIDPAYRGRGLGKALVGHIEALPALSGLRAFLLVHAVASVSMVFFIIICRGGNCKKRDRKEFSSADNMI